MKKLKEKNFISIVVYIDGNEKRIKYFFENVINLMKDNFDKFEFVCVIDENNSKKKETLKKVISKYDGISFNIITMSFHQGLEKSMNAGVDLSIGDFVYEIDTLSIDYNIDDLMSIYNKALTGFDIVSLVPNKTKLFSRCFYKVFNKYSYIHNDINTERVKILSRRAINRIGMIYKNVPYRKVAYANCGLKTINIKYIVKNNKAKETKHEKDLAINSLVLFTSIAYKISILMSVFMIIFTFGVGIYTLVIYLSNKPIEGWTTTMLFLSFSFFGLFILMTIILKYLSIIVDGNYNSKKYLIESIDKVTIEK